MLLIEIGLGLGLESDNIRGLGFQIAIQGHLQNRIKKSRDSALASELVKSIMNRVA